MTHSNVCHKCGKAYPAEDLIWDEKKNRMTCLSCYAEEKMPLCVACGEPCATTGSNYCSECFKKGPKSENTPYICGLCGREMVATEAHNVPGGRPLCETCFNKQTEKPYEYVDRPTHYDIPGTDLQAIDIIHALGYGHGFVMGNLVKMAIRCGRKPGVESIQDMEKSRWYLDDYIRRLKEAGL